MTDQLSTMVHIGLVVVGGAGVAFAAATEIACYSVNPVRLSIRASGGDPAARCLQGELARPDRLLAVIMLAANLFNYLLAVGVEPLLNPEVAGPVAEHTLSDEWRGVLIDIAVITPILLILGESLPKELARVHADRLAYWLARPLWFTRILATGLGALPLVMGVSRLASRLSARLGGPAGGSEHIFIDDAMPHNPASGSRDALTAMCRHFLSLPQDFVDSEAALVVEALEMASQLGGR